LVGEVIGDLLIPPALLVVEAEDGAHHVRLGGDDLELLPFVHDVAVGAAQIHFPSACRRLMTFFTFLLVSVTGISLMRNWNWIFSQSSSLGKSMLSPMEMIRTPASRRSSSSTSPRLLRREKR